ncbi:MAG TPA: TetR/AcrR family transcriptional regulator [Myxococcota bacterium]|jgi:AcrR family transcriptional regulator|nr:TetR/AcrR family transcriptional regulator [Myxococcota bacterium]
MSVLGDLKRVAGRPTARHRGAARRRTYLPAADRRAQILDVARDVFSQRGYHAANIADICSAARIGRGTLYQYFDNKRAVLLSLMEDVKARMRRVLDERPQVEEIPGAREAPPLLIAAFCRARVRALLDAVFADEQTVRLVLREARGLDGGVDRVLAAIDRMVLKAMEADLRAAQRMGVLRPLDARLVARFMLGGVEKMVLQAIADEEPIDLDALARTAVEVELFGLLVDEVRTKEARR